MIDYYYYLFIYFFLAFLIITISLFFSDNILHPLYHKSRRVILMVEPKIIELEMHNMKKQPFLFFIYCSAI